MFRLFWKEKIFRKILACGFSRSANQLHSLCMGDYFKEHEPELCSSATIDFPKKLEVQLPIVKENVLLTLIAEVELR